MFLFIEKIAHEMFRKKIWQCDLDNRNASSNEFFYAFDAATNKDVRGDMRAILQEISQWGPEKRKAEIDRYKNNKNKSNMSSSSVQSGTIKGNIALDAKTLKVCASTICTQYITQFGAQSVLKMVMIGAKCVEAVIKFMQNMLESYRKQVCPPCAVYSQLMLFAKYWAICYSTAIVYIFTFFIISCLDSE